MGQLPRNKNIIMTKQKIFQILNKTFARRIGKSLSESKQNLLNSKLPIYEYTANKLLKSKHEKILLEIGFGMGEHFVHQIKLNPDILYLGIEVYINGVVNALKQLDNCDNFMLWADDFDLILEKVPNNSLDGVYILFPDPWHKRRALKKRLVNKLRLNILKTKLKQGSFIAFASDIQDYFSDVIKLLESDSNLIIKDDNFDIPHDNYIQTKYHRKAITQGHKVQFVQAYKL